MELLGRAEAQSKGLTRYFTGKPCPNGHVSERLVSKCSCVECRRQYVKKYTRGAGRDKAREHRKTYLREKRESDPTAKFVRGARRKLQQILKTKSGSFCHIVGCTPSQLIVYLQSLFQPGMTWGNHGYGEDKWHVDHIRPLASFDLTDLDQQLLACNYTNLQPLWQRDNLSKGSSYAK